MSSHPIPYATPSYAKRNAKPTGANNNTTTVPGYPPIPGAQNGAHQYTTHNPYHTALPPSSGGIDDDTVSNYYNGSTGLSYETTSAYGSYGGAPYYTGHNAHGERCHCYECLGYVGSYESSVGYDTTGAPSLPPAYAPAEALSSALCQCGVCTGNNTPPPVHSAGSSPETSPQHHHAPAPFAPPPPSYEGEHHFAPDAQQPIMDAQVMQHLPPPPPPPPYTECVLGDTSAVEKVMQRWYEKVSALPLSTAPNSRPCPAPQPDRTVSEWIAACNRWWKATYKKPGTGLKPAAARRSELHQ